MGGVLVGVCGAYINNSLNVAPIQVMHFLFDSDRYYVRRRRWSVSHFATATLIRNRFGCYLLYMPMECVKKYNSFVTSICGAMTMLAQ